MSYFSYQGKILIADSLDNGKPGPARWPLNSPDFTLSPTSTEKDHQESYSGLRQVDDQMETVLKCDFSLTLEDDSAENFALALRANKTIIAPSTVTGEPFPGTVAVGDFIVLEQRGAGSLVIHDSAGTPATLTLGTDYAISEFNPNVIEMLNITGFTQPFEASYSDAGGVKLALMNQAPPVKYLIGDLINTRNQQPALVRVYRAKFDLPKALAFINGDYGNLPLTGTCLASRVNGVDPTLGYFGSIDRPAES